MELKCKHSEWEACAKCLDYQQQKTKKLQNGTEPTTMGNNKNELMCKKPWCREKLPMQSLYDSHVKICKKPSSKKSTVCSQCNKQFSKVSNLNRHISTVHSILRKYVCRNCSRSYFDADKLDKHLQRCNYNIHLLKEKADADATLHDDDTEASINVASPENNAYDDNDTSLGGSDDDLPSMVRLEESDDVKNGHTDDECEPMNESNGDVSMTKTLVITNGIFSRKLIKTGANQTNNDMKSLKRRKRKSTICIHCNKQFSRASNLNRHLRTIHGVKKFCCKECKRSFASAEKLNEHFRTMHRYNVSNQSIVVNGGISNEKKVSVIDNILAKMKSNIKNDNNDKDHVNNDVYNEDENTVIVLDNILPVNENEFAKKQNDNNGETHYDYITKGEPIYDKVMIKEQDVEKNYIGRGDDVGTSKIEETFDGGVDSCSGNVTEDEEHLSSNNMNNGLHDSAIDSSDSNITKEEVHLLNDDIHKDIKVKTKRVFCPYCQKQFSKVSNMNRHIFDVHNIRFVCENCSKSFAQREKLEKHLLNSCNPNRNNYKLLKCDTALPSMVIDEVFTNI